LGYAENGDDCDDAWNTVHPGAPERCNDKDDDCDGEVDEGTAPETLYADPDGDGFYGPGVTDTVIGCLPLAGYAAEPGDCAPDDPKRYPGAEEVCNFFDDNCDGRIDELVRPRCGVGRCERESQSCDIGDCLVGAPASETCNGLDDDCNGEMDDGEPCSSGLQCLGLHCVPVEGATAGSGGSEGGSAATSGGGASAATGGSGNAANGGAGGATGGSVATGGSSGSGGGAGATNGAGGSANGAGSGGTSAPQQPTALRPEKSTGCEVSAGRDRAFSLLAFALVFGLGLLIRRRHGWLQH
jgi:hypothetical protein